MSAKTRNRDWLAITGYLATWLGVAAAFTAVSLQHEDAKEFVGAQKELVRAQVAIEMIKLFDSAEMRRARRELAKELQGKDATHLSETRALDFFETLANYRRLRRIDEETVYSNFSYYIERYWIASEPYVRTFRKLQNDDTFYVGFQELNAENLKGETAVLAREEINRFLQEEATLSK